jgi:hypothetical protein
MAQQKLNNGMSGLNGLLARRKVAAGDDGQFVFRK